MMKDVKIAGTPFSIDKRKLVESLEAMFAEATKYSRRYVKDADDKLYCYEEGGGRYGDGEWILKETIDDPSLVALYRAISNLEKC